MAEQPSQNHDHVDITNLLHIENLTIPSLTIQIVNLHTPTGGGACEEPSAPGAPTTDRLGGFGAHRLLSSNSGDGDIPFTANKRIVARPAVLTGPNFDPTGELIMPRDGSQGREEVDNMDPNVKVEMGPWNEYEKANEEEEHGDNSSSEFSILNINLPTRE